MSSSSSSSSSSSGGTQKSTQGSLPTLDLWRCDDLTPQLCTDLETEFASVQIRGIDVSFWKYTSPSGKLIAANNNNKNTAALLRLPIVVIPGGPGMSHEYLLPLKQQACRGRDVYFYDPAGCGRSSVPRNSTTTTTTSSSSSTTSEEQQPPPVELPSHLVDLTYYATEELPYLLQHWKLLDGGGNKPNPKFHLWGHGEGGIVAMLYAVNATLSTSSKTNNLASMTVASGYSDKRLYQKAQWDPQTGTLGRLPVFVQERLAKLLQSQDFYRSSEYWEILSFIYRSFYGRTHPSPDCLLASLRGTNWMIYSKINGPAGNFWSPPTTGNNSKAVGTMPANWSITSELTKLPSSLPVLLMTGGSQFDIVRPIVTDLLEHNIPTTERIEIINAGHMMMMDDPGSVNNATADFLDRVEVSFSSRGGVSKFKPQATMAVSSTFSGLGQLFDEGAHNYQSSSSSSSSVVTRTNDGYFPTTSSGDGSHFHAGNAILFLLFLVGGTVMFRKYQARSALRAAYSQLQDSHLVRV